MKIIANGVTNLTDARYFAAMGVDWIGFDMGTDSPLSIEHVIAFSDWVEGPLFYLDVRGRPEEQIAEMLGSFQADGLRTEEGVSLPHYAGKIISVRQNSDIVNDHADILIYSFEEWQQIISNNEAIVAEDAWVAVDNANEYRSLNTSIDRIMGIVVSGGDEEKTGLKPYDDLDEIMELVNG